MLGRDLGPTFGEEVAARESALAGDDDDVPDRRGIALKRDRVHGHAREDRAIRAVERTEELRVLPLDGADHVRDDDPSGREPVAHELEELLRRQVEGQRVRVVRVEHDHVPAPVVSLEVATAVLDLDGEPWILRQREPLPRDVDDLGVELDRLELQVGEVSPRALRRRAAAEPDVERVRRLRPVREREREIGHVVERRHERVVEVHRALEGAVEAEVAVLLVLDDRDRVVRAVLAVPHADSPRRRSPCCRRRSPPGGGRPASSSPRRQR